MQPKEPTCQRTIIFLVAHLLNHPRNGIQYSINAHISTLLQSQSFDIFTFAYPSPPKPRSSDDLLRFRWRISAEMLKYRVVFSKDIVHQMFQEN